IWARQISLGLKIAYAYAHNNLKFLEKRGFIRMTSHGKAGAKLYELTLRGLLASFFSPTFPPENEELDVLRKIDWGPRYPNAFQNVKSLSDLKAFVEMIYNVGSNLEEINEDILMRIIRDPNDINLILDLLRHAKVMPISFQPQKPGKHIVSIPAIPGSFAFSRITGLGNYANLIINPTKEIGENLLKLLENPENEDYIGKVIAVFLESLITYLSDKQEKAFIQYYNPKHRIFIISGVMPKEITERLLYPEQILFCIQQHYHGIVNWLRCDVKDERGIYGTIYLGGLQYDPKSKEIRQISKEEVFEKIIELSEELKKERQQRS
ncbi:MAG: hypothetical protein N3E47_07855, partial [Candidatus Bathyarchaeota archaeon]|nr:hypothetical protein [Candidatus Bathyarchaeota archaeon]